MLPPESPGADAAALAAPALPQLARQRKLDEVCLVRQLLAAEKRPRPLLLVVLALSRLPPVPLVLAVAVFP